MTEIGVISDTHGNVEGVQRAVAILRMRRVSRVIHCGDVGPRVVELLSDFQTDLVPGNVDDLYDLRAEIIEPHHTLHREMGSIEVEGKRIAFLHGDNARLLRQLIQSGEWDLICHGHSHTFSNTSHGRTRVLNPGALYRTSHPSLATVVLPAFDVLEVPLPPRS